MSQEDGLICAYRVDANGRGYELGWDELDGSRDDEAYRWIHLELGAPDVEAWIQQHSGLDELEIEALLAEETRPRVTPIAGGAIINLRGVNLNPGADPEDMVAVRLWVEAGRVISVRRRPLLALQDLRAQLVSGRGARNVGEFVAELADRLVERMATFIGSLDEGLDEIEADSDKEKADLRTRLLDLRREAILLKRYLSPQRDALSRLAGERFDWLGEHERLQLREVLDRTTRYVEDLETARERAAVCQEEITSRTADQLNRRMYALSIVAGIFLPLSFATGLLGINVAGIPGAEIDWAFAAVCGLLVLLGIAEIALFKRLRWL